jgi:cysteine desulfurase
MTAIYLDYNASTPVAPQVVDAVRAALEDAYGNPSSPHWAGVPAKLLLERSRAQVAALLGCSSEEIVFTSGGSEANNFAVKGVFYARRGRPVHVITSSTEHPSVLEPCGFLERQGARVTRLHVDGAGLVDPDDLRHAISPETALVTLMHANNETGTIQPVEECARIAHEHGIPFHTDAAQTVGKLATSVDSLGVDLLTVVGHKMYAPKGVGALYVRAGTALEPLVHGAGHERGRRAGTESAMLAAALGAACDLARDLQWTVHARALRDRLWTALKERLGEGVVLNGHVTRRLPNTLNVSFLGRVGADVLAAATGVAASTGSACHSGRVEISPVLRAMGVTPESGAGAVRFSLGRFTTEAEIDAAIEAIASALSRPAPVST